jgi:hypothetical protein
MAVSSMTVLSGRAKACCNASSVVSTFCFSASIVRGNSAIDGNARLLNQLGKERSLGEVHNIYRQG